MMKYLFLMFSLLFFSNYMLHAQDSTFSQNKRGLHEIGVQKYSQRLSLIDTLTSDLIVHIADRSYSLKDLKQLIDFFERITGIPSTVENPIIGPHKIPRVDYINWAIWFENNKNNLYWDKKLKQVVVNDSI